MLAVLRLTAELDGGFMVSSVPMRTIVILVLITLAALPLGSLAAQSMHPDLNGRVFAEQGRPLKGASVFIYTAGPKVGVGTL